jgi:hypothetical protein
VSLRSVAEDLNRDVNWSVANAADRFVSDINRRFKSGEGFYGWSGLRYFLYEYEYEKGEQNRLQKIDWKLFTTVEKDKVTIEHVLPQAPTKDYWQDAFKSFNEDEIKQLSGSLGNLLPLSRSINASLQNDGFPDKKNPREDGRRGYVHGSHSEIEVSRSDHWTADEILKRGMKLLAFLERRWGVEFSDGQKLELLHIKFVGNEAEDC